METAIEAAVFLPLAFDQVEGIQSSLDVFPGTMRHAETIKPFHTRTAVCLDDIASVRAEGGTPMREAIQISGKSLLETTADRRLLIVVTDGRPFSLEETRREVQSLEREDVEVIGIGIGRGTKVGLKAIFNDYCVINDIGELTDQLYQVMQQKLLAQPLAA